MICLTKEIELQLTKNFSSEITNPQNLLYFCLYWKEIQLVAFIQVLHHYSFEV